MAKPLFLLVGKSASGKTTVAEILESKYGLKSIQSYTTRPKRYESETGHTFITNEEFDKLQDIIAYTEYNNHRYCCTKEQIDAADIYVVDVPGVETLLERYRSERKIVIFYFDTSVHTRIERMLNRHDSDNAIVSRLYTDEEFDWRMRLEDFLWGNGIDAVVRLYTIDTDTSLDDVLTQVLNLVKLYGGIAT